MKSDQILDILCCNVDYRKTPEYWKFRNNLPTWSELNKYCSLCWRVTRWNFEIQECYIKVSNYLSVPVANLGSQMKTIFLWQRIKISQCFFCNANLNENLNSLKFRNDLLKPWRKLNGASGVLMICRLVYAGKAGDPIVNICESKLISRKE